MVIYFDIKYFIIPDYITLPLIPIGLFFSFLIKSPTFYSSLFAGVAAFGLTYFIAFCYERKYKQIGLGGGDIKYITAIATFTGVNGTFYILTISSASALLFFFITYCFKKSINVLPYGAFLAGAAIIYYILIK